EGVRAARGAAPGFPAGRDPRLRSPDRGSAGPGCGAQGSPHPPSEGPEHRGPRGAPHPGGAGGAGGRAPRVRQRGRHGVARTQWGGGL
ncbi:hypothetical protein DR093_03165, partial [Mycoplasma flocculare]|nr:hypothetical protein [Mesomycoplasma flocculare]